MVKWSECLASTSPILVPIHTIKALAVVVAQLAEQLLLTQQDMGLNPAIKYLDKLLTVNGWNNENEYEAWNLKLLHLI